MNQGSDDSSYLSDDDSGDEEESAEIEMPYEVEYGEEKTINISLPSNATGNLVVYNGTFNQSSYNYKWEILANISLKDGKAAYDVYKLPLGNYHLKAIYDAEDYNVYGTEHDVIIVPAIKINSYIYENLNDYAEILLPSDTNRTLIVSIKDYYGNVIEELFNASAKGTVKVNIPKLDYDEYSLSVSYGDVEKTAYFYYGDWVRVPETVVEDYDDDIYADIYGFEGYVEFFIDGKLFDVKTLNEMGVAYFSLKDVAMGNHTYEIIYFDNNNVKQLNKSGSFKKDYNFGTNLEDETYPFTEEFLVSVSLPEEATGKITINFNGKNYTADIVDGYADVYVDNLVSGENNVTITYSGDSKYPTRQIKKVITVEGYAVFEQYDENGFAYISLILPENAAGNLTLYKCVWDEDKWEWTNKTVLMSKKLVNGTAKFLKSEFKYGLYNNIFAEYDGTDYDVQRLENIYFKVLPEMTIPDIIVVGDKLPISINIPGANGNILVFEGIYNESSDNYDKVAMLANITSNNGLFETNISGLKFDEHDLIFEYVGNDSDDFFEGVSCGVRVYPLNFDVPEIGNSDGSVEITLQLPEGLSGKVYVYAYSDFDDDILLFEGSYSSSNKTFVVKNVDDEYSFKVVYSDNKYGNFTFYGDGVIPNPDVSADVIIPETTSSDSFDVVLPKNATGGILVTIDDESTYIPLVNGTAKIDLSKLEEGPHTITISYPGDNNYAGFEKTSTVVIKRSVDSKIIASNLKVMYSAGTLYSVTIYGTDGKVAPNTEVVFLVNGKTFRRFSVNTK